MDIFPRVGRIEGEDRVKISVVTERREDGWWMAAVLTQTAADFVKFSSVPSVRFDEMKMRSEKW